MRDSEDRKPVATDPDKWICYDLPRLRIIPDVLWNKVHAIQTAKSPCHEAVKRGIAKKASGHDSKYWLGTILVCECGSNYIGNGTRDYVCPSHISNSCDNDMRFRRDDTHVAVFDLLHEHLLNDKQITIGQEYAEQALRERVRAEDQAARDVERGVDLRRLDDEIRQLHAMPLRPAALAAAIAEIESERSEVLAKATGKRDRRENRTRQLLARLPDIVRAYRQQLQRAVKVLADDRLVHDARELARGLLVDRQIVLAPQPLTIRP